MVQSSKHKHRLLGGLFLLGFGVASGTWFVQAAPAQAQGLEARSGARAVANQALASFEAEQWLRAVDLFERAETLVHSLMHLVYLSRAQVKLGRWLEAEDNYLRILRESLPKGAPSVFLQAQADAARELAALKARIPHVTLVLPPVAGNEEFYVSLDGRRLPRAVVGLPAPIDTGVHEWRLEDSSGRVAVVTRTIAEGTRVSIELSFPTVKTAVVRGLTPANNDTLGSISANANSGGFAEEGANPESNSVGAPGPAGGWGWGTYSSVAVAVAGTGVGLGLYIRAMSIGNYLELQCLDGVCPVNSRNQKLIEDQARSYTISAIGLGVGAVALAVTGALLLTSDTSESARLAVSVGPMGATVWGNF